MSKRAEDAALKAFPKRKDGRVRGYTCTDDDVRRLYAKGYRKAEKDIKDALLEWAKEHYTGMDITKRDMWDGGYNCAMKQLIDKLNEM